jgi:hypothetical protein
MFPIRSAQVSALAYRTEKWIQFSELDDAQLKVEHRMDPESGVHF